MLEIFSPIVEEYKMHNNFKLLLRDGHAPARDVIKSWTDGFIDRDGKIVKEFQTTFNSSFWEFYLNACFNQLGFIINYSYDRPDFIISKNGSSFAVEATIANNPHDGVGEWERNPPRQLDQKDIFNILNLATLRIANAIFTKYKKLTRDYLELRYVKNKPFILCIAPFEQPYFFCSLM